MTDVNETTSAPEPASAPEPLITVDVWTDVMCPWCYIGESRLHDAIEAEGLSGQVHIRAHSFELDPTSPTDSVRDNVSHLVASKGMPEEQVREMESQIKGMAEEIGREYVTDRPMANTRGVHRVMQAVAAEAGEDAGTEFFMQLQRGYFTGESDPFDTETVVAAAATAGLGEDVARAALSGTSYDEQVEIDVQQAVQLGARGVPFFVFNEKYSAPGALPLEGFRQALTQIAEEARTEREQAAGQEQS